MKTVKKVTPNMGGCWFCHMQDESLTFDFEFDTYVHKKCIKDALTKEPHHPEACFMKYLIEDQG